MATMIETLSAAEALKGAGFDEVRADAIVVQVKQSSEFPTPITSPPRTIWRRRS